MKIIVTGDIHNEFGDLNALLNHKKPDLVLCCGDFGFWPNKPWAKDLSEIKLQGTEKILWCDGNHEDHWALRDREKDEMVPGVIYMPRGSTYTLPDGRVILFMGGADSIDKAWRTEGDTWFREELITQKDFENLPDCKIDIIVSHTCPEELVPKLQLKYPHKEMEPSNKALTALWEMYNPPLWFFGHWHQSLDIKLKDTQFYCLSAPGMQDHWWMNMP